MGVLENVFAIGGGLFVLWIVVKGAIPAMQGKGYPTALLTGKAIEPSEKAIEAELESMHAVLLEHVRGTLWALTEPSEATPVDEDGQPSLEANKTYLRSVENLVGLYGRLLEDEQLTVVKLYSHALTYELWGGMLSEIGITVNAREATLGIMEFVQREDVWL